MTYRRETFWRQVDITKRDTGVITDSVRFQLSHFPSIPSLHHCNTIGSRCLSKRAKIQNMATGSPAIEFAWEH